FIAKVNDYIISNSQKIKTLSCICGISLAIGYCVKKGKEYCYKKFLNEVNKIKRIQRHIDQKDFNCKTLIVPIQNLLNRYQLKSEYEITYNIIPSEKKNYQREEHQSNSNSNSNLNLNSIKQNSDH